MRRGFWIFWTAINQSVKSTFCVIALSDFVLDTNELTEIYGNPLNSNSDVCRPEQEIQLHFSHNQSAQFQQGNAVVFKDDIIVFHVCNNMSLLDRLSLTWYSRIGWIRTSCCAKRKIKVCFCLHNTVELGFKGLNNELPWWTCCNLWCDSAQPALSMYLFP